MSTHGLVVRRRNQGPGRRAARGLLLAVIYSSFKRVGTLLAQTPPVLGPRHQIKQRVLAGVRHLSSAHDPSLELNHVAAFGSPPNKDKVAELLYSNHLREGFGKDVHASVALGKGKRKGVRK